MTHNPETALDALPSIDAQADYIAQWFRAFHAEIKQALSPGVVDVEGLKRQCYGDSPIQCRASIDRAIDYLAQNNLICNAPKENA